MFEIAHTPTHEAAYDRAHQLRADVLASAFRRMRRRIFAARPQTAVTTKKGAGRAQPAPTHACA